MKRKGISLAAVLVLGAAASFGTFADDQTADEATVRDQLHAKVQEICPVTGNKLGTHGKPIKVKIGKENVFLCCKACLKGKVDAKHWGTIHSNFVTAQAKCPVMDKPLPDDPKWTIVEGKIVYICCPPCTKKIAAEPAKYLKQVDKLYTASLKQEADAR